MEGPDPVRFAVPYPDRTLNRLTSALRIYAYVLITDEYPPLRLAP